MNNDTQSAKSGGFRWRLFLGILLLTSSVYSGALLFASPDSERSLIAGSAGKTRGVPDLLDRPAVKADKPEKHVLLGITKAGDRLVAVGERGIIVCSDDRGESWHQSKVPTSVALTAVTFPTKDIGWAIGHAGTVLHTTDAGETWSRQLDGVSAARIAYEEAKAYAASTEPDDPLAERFLSDAKLLIDDGPDKPFLDIHFTNEKEGIIVGAYGLIFHTGDSGKTWTSWMTRVDNPGGLHFYTIQQNRNLIHLAGEQGLYLRSMDSGKSFQKINTGYRGSYFTSTLIGEDVFIVAGMRGNVYRSIDDETKAFTQMEVPVPVTILSCLTTQEGTIVLINQAGYILGNNFNRPNHFKMIGSSRLKSMVASVIQLDKGSLLGVGNNGVVKIPLSIENSDKTKGEL